MTMTFNEWLAFLHFRKKARDLADKSWQAHLDLQLTGIALIDGTYYVRPKTNNNHE